MTPISLSLFSISDFSLYLCSRKKNKLELLNFTTENKNKKNDDLLSFLQKLKLK